MKTRSFRYFESMNQSRSASKRQEWNQKLGLVLGGNIGPAILQLAHQLCNSVHSSGYTTAFTNKPPSGNSVSFLFFKLREFAIC